MNFQTAATAGNSVLARQPESDREFLLNEIRCLALRTRLITTEIDSIGAALRGGQIGPECAAEWLADLGVLDWIRKPECRAGGQDCPSERPAQ